MVDAVIQRATFRSSYHICPTTDFVSTIKTWLFCKCFLKFDLELNLFFRSTSTILFLRHCTKCNVCSPCLSDFLKISPLHRSWIIRCKSLRADKQVRNNSFRLVANVLVCSLSVPRASGESNMMLFFPEVYDCSWSLHSE